jgi:hypothetical protein
MRGVGVPHSEVSRLASIVGCKEGSIPFCCLGLPIAVSMTKIICWKPLLEEFKKKLSNWRINSLSVGERLTLCKSVLGSLVVYFLSLYKAPSRVIKELEGARRKFF